MEVKPAFWGAICGAAALAVVGFNWGGWVTGGAAEALASKRASTAVVSVLAPICADNFNKGKDASTQLAELKKVKSWEQGAYVTKSGWATMPGTAAVDNGVANSCAEMILASKP